MYNDVGDVFVGTVNGNGGNVNVSTGNLNASNYFLRHCQNTTTNVREGIQMSVLSM